MSQAPSVREPSVAELVAGLRAHVRAAVDRAEPAKLQAILTLLDEEYIPQEEIDRVNALIDEALASGPPIPVDEKFWADLRAEVHAGAEARRKRTP